MMPPADIFPIDLRSISYVYRAHSGCGTSSPCAFHLTPDWFLPSPPSPAANCVSHRIPTPSRRSVVSRVRVPTQRRHGPTAPCGEHRRCHVDRVLRFALLGSRRSLLLSLHTQCDSLDPPPKLSVFCDIYYRVIVLLMRDEPAVGFFSLPTFASFAMKFALHPPPLFQTHPLFSSDSYHAGCPLSGSAAGSIWDVFLFSVRSTSGPFHTT